MKKNKLIFGLLLVLVVMGANYKINAQEYYEFYDGRYGYVSNSNARLVASINEAGEEVQIDILALGYLSLGVFTVSLSYDPTVVAPIMGAGGVDITLNLTNFASLGSYFWINPDLPDVTRWRSMATGNLKAAESAPTTYVTIGEPANNLRVTLEDGKILQIFKFFFRKLPGQTLTETTFTYYNRPVPPVQQNQYFHGVYVRQIGGDAPPAVNLYSPMFTRRSPATIETEAPIVQGTRVTLKGLANAEGIARQTGSEQLLDWDHIVRTGFIYSKSDVALTIDAYSQKIKVNGAEYDFPALSEGVFTLGAYDFNIVTTENTNSYTRIAMEETIRGLEAETPYYAYAFMVYKFQTSQAYPVLGEQIMFKPTFCNEQPLVLSETEFSVCNTVSGVKLGYENYTEEATYKLVFDAAGVEAGFLNMDNYALLPETAIEIGIPYGASAGNYVATLLVREGECEKAYAISIELRGAPGIVSTSETELFVKEGEEFILLVETTGVTDYQWYFEGVSIEGATQCFYSDIFHTNKEGIYTVNIFNECGLRSVDFEVKSMLNVTDITIDNYKLTAYPNPNIKGSILFLQLEVPGNEATEAIAHIIDVMGKEVLQYSLTKTLTELKLNVAEGAYLIRVNTKSGKELLTKVVVQQ